MSSVLFWITAFVIYVAGVIGAHVFQSWMFARGFYPTLVQAWHMWDTPQQAFERWHKEDEHYYRMFMWPVSLTVYVAAYFIAGVMLAICYPVYAFVQALPTRETLQHRFTPKLATTENNDKHLSPYRQLGAQLEVQTLCDNCQMSTLTNGNKFSNHSKRCPPVTTHDLGPL
jgi:multidrug efflux pump subunit AcrB